MQQANRLRRSPSRRNIFAALREVLCGARNAMSGRRYRPEQHYMRGPGPKTRAKLERGSGAGA